MPETNVNVPMLSFVYMVERNMILGMLQNVESYKREDILEAYYAYRRNGFRHETDVPAPEDFKMPQSVVDAADEATRKMWETYEKNHEENEQNENSEN